MLSNRKYLKQTSFIHTGLRDTLPMIQRSFVKHADEWAIAKLNSNNYRHKNSPIREG